MSIATTTASTVFRRLPRGLGDRAGANLYYRAFLKDSSAPPTNAQVGRARFELDLSDWPQAQAYMLGTYDPETVGFIAEHLPDDGTFVDGGAHVGLISLQIAALRPAADIHSFEPHPAKHAALLKNVADNPSGVTPVELGLSDRSGIAEFDLDLWSIDDGGEHLGLDLGRESRGPAQRAQISTISLDEYMQQNGIDTIDVLKLDIEGHELAALHGAREALAAGNIRAVTMEAMHGDTDEPADFLLEHGFQPVPMPDLRAPWIQRRRPLLSENVGFVLAD